MKILVLLAKGFETMELSPFIDVFGWVHNDFGIDIEVETCGFSKTVVSTFGVPVIVDRLIDEISEDDYDALAIPGGFEEYGFYEEAYCERFCNLINEFDKSKKPIATVCVAALALGKSGIIKGRRSTTYHLGDGKRQHQLSEFGATVVNEPVVTDGNIITSYCPQTAPLVAFALLSMLTSEDIIKKVSLAMGFENIQLCRTLC